MKKPAIRFKGYTGEWIEKTLGDVASAFDYGLNAAATNYDGKNKYIRITDIDDRSHRFSQENLSSPDTDLKNADNYLVKSGDILFARTGASVGKSYLYNKDDGKVYYAGFLIRASVKDGISPDFVFQNTMTDNYKRFVKITSQRSGQPGVNAAEYKTYSFLSPKDKAEQASIGLFFKNLDSLIEGKRVKLDKLKKLKQAYLGKMFPKKGSRVPEVRFKGFAGDWEEKLLGNIGSSYTGLSGKGKADFGHGRASYITYMNVFSNPVATLEQTDRIEVDKKQNCVKKNDIFFTVSSETPEEVGMSSVWTYEIENVYLNSFCFGFRPNENIDPYYFAYLMRSPLERSQIILLAQGISRFNISKSKMMNISVLLPTVPEQKKIGAFFQNLDNLINLQLKELDKLTNIKSACLSKMFA